MIVKIPGKVWEELNPELLDFIRGLNMDEPYYQKTGRGYMYVCTDVSIAQGDALATYLREQGAERLAEKSNNEVPRIMLKLSTKIKEEVEELKAWPWPK